MKLPELPEIQFQASAQSNTFDPLKLPDPNPQLQQNLSIIQQSFSNLAQSGTAASFAKDPTFMQQFAELLPKTLQTAVQLQNVDVAIQTARADDRYYQMLQQGLIPQSGEALAIEQVEKERDGVVNNIAAEAAKTNNYDTVRGILNFSNHGEIALRRRMAQHMFTNVYPDWMKTQLESNESTIPVEDAEGNLVEVQINQPGLPDYQHKQIMSHLRTAFMGHELLADTNNDFIQKEMAIGFKTDNAISRQYSRETRAADGKTRFSALWTSIFDKVIAGDYGALGRGYLESKSIPDEKGIGFTNTPAEFYDRYIKNVVAAGENGVDLDVSTFVTKGTFEDGQTFMERAPQQARRLVREYREARRKYLSNKLKADTQDLKFAITEFNQQALQEPKTVSDFVTFKTLIRAKAAEIGVDPTDMLKLVNNGMRLASQGADEINGLREQAEIALATGNASQTADYYLHPIVGPEIREKVDKQVARKQSPEYKTASKEISDSIAGTSATMVDPQGQLKGQAVRVNAHYQRIFNDKFIELQDQNATKSAENRLTDQALAAQARDAALAQWEKDKIDKTHRYYVNPKNGSFPNFPVPEADAAEVAQTQNVATIVSAAKAIPPKDKDSKGKTVQTGVLGQIAKQPQLIMSDTDVTAAISNFSKNGSIHPTLEKLQKKINNAAGIKVIQNPMQLAIAAAQGYGILKPGEVPQDPVFLQRAGTTSQKVQMMKDLLGLKGNLYTLPTKYVPVAQMPTRRGMPNVAPVFQGDAPEGLTGLTAADYRELAFIVSAEAGPGDDKYAVAASVINRLADGRFGSSIAEIGRRPGQYEAVYTGKAFYSNELTQDLASPEGQKKIAQMLMLLDGRTDFKGQTQLGNRDPDNDPMVDPLGNFFHYAGQTGMGPYTGTVNRNYRRFLK